jgi:hypothetical protein
MIEWWMHYNLLEFVEGSKMEVLWFVIKMKTMCVGVVWVLCGSNNGGNVRFCFTFVIMDFLV